MALTAKQARFVDEYLVDLNATQAAIRAGYAPSTADKKAAGWVGKSRDTSTAPEIWDAVNERLERQREELEAKTGISKAWVLEKLRLNVERSMEAEPVFDSQGVPTGVYRYAGNVANRALELIGKELGMFVEGGSDEGSPSAPTRRTVRYSRDNEAGR